jgi:hypothetical protein
MPFENFYKEQDDDARRWWKCMGAAFLLLTGYLFLSFVGILHQESSAVPPVVAPPTLFLTSEERVARVEALCQRLPRPEEFYLVSKTANSETESVAQARYFYTSPRAPQEIMPHFIFWFNENGWQKYRDSDSVFVKDGQTIGIRHRSDRDADYEISCSQTFR